MARHAGRRAGAKLRGARRWVSAIFALASAGCLVGPDYVRPPVPLNAGWGQQPDKRIETRRSADAAWWKTFKDPALDRLVDIAYRQNVPLQIAGLRILEARAQLGIAIGQQYPVNQRPVAGGQGLGIHNSDLNLFLGSYQVGFDALWEPDLWGKFRRGVKAARAGYLASVADYADALVSLTAEVARTYVVIRTFQVQIALARDNAAIQEDGLRIAQARFKAGATSALDVTQAQNLLETTRSTIPELELELRVAQNALCTLFGRPTGCNEAQLDGPEAIPAAPAQVAVGVPAELLRRRPDIRSAELSAMAQCDRIGIAKAELFPRFTLFGALGTRQVASTGAPSGVSPLLGLFSPGTLLYTFGGDLFWPLLNYPKILDNVRVQDARFQQSLFAYQDTVLRAAREVEDAISGFLKLQEAVAFSESAVTPAQESVKLALVQYREGAVDYQRVLDTQRVLLQSQANLTRTRSAVATALVALYKALGGGWELHQGQPVITESTRSEMQKRTNWGKYLSKPPEPMKLDEAPPSP